jgi:uncharacterized membrane protein YhaH (DUF805 family)
MGFGDAVRVVPQKAFDWSGRATRPEFWWWYLAAFIIDLIAYILFVAVIGHAIGLILYYVVALLVLVPSLAVGARRLHDTDKSAWWLLLYFACGIGGIVVLILCALEGTPGPNKYGPPA